MPTAPAPADWATRDYELDIGGCVSRGWNLYKENFGTLFVTFLMVIAVMFAASFVLGLFMAPVNKALMQTPVYCQIGVRYLFSLATPLIFGPMFGGLYFVYLKVIRQQATSAGDAFAGFQKFGQLYLGAMVVGLITNLCLLPFQYDLLLKAGPVLQQLQQAQATHATPADVKIMFHDLLQAYGASFWVFLLCVIPTTYLAVSWSFTLPLIMDQEMNFWTAMKTSFKMVNRHWLAVFGLTVLAGLITLGGIFGCCIGMLFTAPIGIAAMMFAYETIFCASGRQNG